MINREHKLSVVGQCELLGLARPGAYYEPKAIRSVASTGPTLIVNRYGGDRYVKSLTCADQFRVMERDFAPISHVASQPIFLVAGAQARFLSVRSTTRGEAEPWRI